MTKKMSPRLKRALEVFEIGELDLVIRKKRPEDLAALRGLLTTDRDVDPEHRQRALYALGRWGDKKAVDDIVAVLPDVSEPERITALDALGRLGTAKARAAIESCADDKSDDVRKFVVAALSRIDDSGARRKLRQMADEDSADWVQHLAGRALRSKAK